MVTYNLIENEQSKKNNKTQKALLLIPGATGGSEGGHMQIFTKEAHENGFHVLIPNHIAPKDSAHRDDLEIIDFT